MRTDSQGRIFFNAPKNFTVNAIEEFLNEVQVLFSWPNKMVQNVTIDFSNIKKINIVGLLLTYKIIDFTYMNHCFSKPNLNTSTSLEQEWTRFQFWDLIKAYISNKDVTERAYREFKVRVENHFIIAPQALLRGSKYTHDYLQKEFLPKISDHYSFNDKIVTNVFTCLSEILLNFWEHAVEDSKSIILAGGNQSKVEIACADTGKGIVSTLAPYFPELKEKPVEILEKAICRGVTSKKNSFHMGYGLWIVDEIIKNNNSRLHIYSEGYFYKNDYGKVSKGKCGYWRGTIVYINLDITDPVTPTDFNMIDIETFEDLKINFT